MNFPSVRLNTKLGQRAQERVEMMVREEVWRRVWEVKIEVESKVEMLRKSSFDGVLFGSGQDWGCVMELTQVWKEKKVIKFKNFVMESITLASMKQQ